MHAQLRKVVLLPLHAAVNSRHSRQLGEVGRMENFTPSTVLAVRRDRNEDITWW